jgi:hypothetical protein
MGVAVQWDDTQQTVIRWDFEPNWTWDELADSARVSSAMIASADVPVGIILNLLNSRAPSGRITAYHRSAFEYLPSNMGSLVMVCDTELCAAQLVMPFFPQMHMADSLSEARALLHLQPAA